MAIKSLMKLGPKFNHTVYITRKTNFLVIWYIHLQSNGIELLSHPSVRDLQLHSRNFIIKKQCNVSHVTMLSDFVIKHKESLLFKVNTMFLNSHCKKFKYK